MAEHRVGERYERRGKGRGGTTKAKTARQYGEVFESLMSYAEARVGRTKIKSREDLAKLFESLDAHRKDKQESPKISDKLINILIDHPRAKRYLGGTIGHGRGQPTISNKYVEANKEKILRYRSEGRSLYSTDKGIVVKIVYKTKRGNQRIGFRNIDNGKFVSKDTITGDA